MRYVAPRALAMILSVGMLLALPALAADEAGDDESGLAAQDFSDFALQLDTTGASDDTLEWTAIKPSDSGFRLDSGLRFHWPPAMGAAAVARPNQLASWKPSSGMRVDYSGRDEAVFLRWRLGF